jgi:integrase
MALIKRGNIWWIDLVHRGRRSRKSTGTTDREAARQQHDELKARLWRQRLVSPETWFQAQAEWLRVEPRDEQDKSRLRALNRVYPDRPLSQITSASLQAAIADRGASTYNRYLNVIKAILNLARARGWIEAVPRLVARKSPAGRVRWLSAEEWTRLEAELPPHLLGPARFALATGLRQHNVTHLEWSQIDLRRRVAWIHPDQAKGRTAIGVPLSDDALAVLRAQLAERDRLKGELEAVPADTPPSKLRVRRAQLEAFGRWAFPYNGAPIDKIKGAWMRAQERAGLGRFVPKIDAKGKQIGQDWDGDFTWHDLRHTWASWHAMSGTPLPVLQQLGGWKTLQMVMRYAHLAPEHLAGHANNARPVSLRHDAPHIEEKKSA